ncbi:hypothetical protein [Aliamphritea spongicola]|nr:hypothetical protein [Aliamphritea spongicola]
MPVRKPKPRKRPAKKSAANPEVPAVKPKKKSVRASLSKAEQEMMTLSKNSRKG